MKTKESTNDGFIPFAMRFESSDIGHLAGSNCWSCVESMLDVIDFAKSYGFEPDEFNSEDLMEVCEVSDEAVEYLNEAEKPDFTYFTIHDNELYLMVDTGWAVEECPNVFEDYKNDMPEDFTGLAVNVNDHGNATYGYYFQGTLQDEIWSVV